MSWPRRLPSARLATARRPATTAGRSTGASWRFGPKMRPGSRLSGGRGGGGSSCVSASGSAAGRSKPAGVQVRAAPRRPAPPPRSPSPASGRSWRTRRAAGCSSPRGIASMHQRPRRAPGRGRPGGSARPPRCTRRRACRDRGQHRRRRSVGHVQLPSPPVALHLHDPRHLRLARRRPARDTVNRSRPAAVNGPRSFTPSPNSTTSLRRSLVRWTSPGCPARRGAARTTCSPAARGPRGCSRRPAAAATNAPYRSDRVGAGHQVDEPVGAGRVVDRGERLQALGAQRRVVLGEPARVRPRRRSGRGTRAPRPRRTAPTATGSPARPAGARRLSPPSASSFTAAVSAVAGSSSSSSSFRRYSAVRRRRDDRHLPGDQQEPVVVVPVRVRHVHQDEFPGLGLGTFRFGSAVAWKVAVEPLGDVVGHARVLVAGVQQEVVRPGADAPCRRPRRGRAVERLSVGVRSRAGGLAVRRDELPGERPAPRPSPTGCRA